MANRTRSKKRNTQRKNKKSKKMYNQRGGVFTQEQVDILANQGGFNDDEINFLNQNNVSFANVQTATNFVLENNQQTIAVFIASCLHNNPNQNNQNEIQQGNNQNEIQQGLNIDDLQGANQNGDLHIDDLQGQGEGEGEGENNLNDAFIQGNNNDELNNSGETDPELGSFSYDDDDENDGDGNGDLGWNNQPNQPGGRRRKTRKGRKGKNGKNGKKSRKQRGGMRYGTGVGSNCFEPNYSIYNTPTLSLFPYKPN
jgi:hypothetical protein